MNQLSSRIPLKNKIGLHPFFWLMLGVLFIFFFIGGPDYYSSRLFRQVWDIGHIVFFSLLIYAVLNISKTLQQKSFILKLTLVMVLTLVLGIIIEWVQIGLGRSSELDDVIRDLLGALIPLVFFSKFSADLNKGIRIILRFILILFLFYFLSPLFISIGDEVNARNQFPVLSDFETPFEISRWSDENEMSEDSNIISQGTSSLRVVLNTDEYAGISLKHFPGNWQGFSTLKFSIYNSLDIPIDIEARLNDADHLNNNQEYHDRYNTSFSLAPGWNNLDIDLNEVMNAPRDRTMDMGKINMFRVFVSKLNEPVTIYLDNFHLSK